MLFLMKLNMSMSSERGLKVSLALTYKDEDFTLLKIFLFSVDSFIPDDPEDAYRHNAFKLTRFNAVKQV